MNKAAKLMKDAQQMIDNHIAEGKATKRELAGAIGIDPTTFSRKCKGTSSWRLDEILEVIHIIRPQLLSDIDTMTEAHR